MHDRQWSSQEIARSLRKVEINKNRVYESELKAKKLIIKSW